MPYNFRLTTYLSVALALLGIFFLISSPNSSENSGIGNTNYSKVLGSSATKSWSQNSFAGGINSGPYTVPWGSTGGWSSYSSITNLSLNSLGLALVDPNQPAEFISSIFDQGNYRATPGAAFNGGGGSYGVAGSNYNTFSWMRGANSASAVSSAPWVAIGTSTCPVPFRYIQLKVTYPIVQTGTPYTVTDPISRIDLAGQLQIIAGYVKDSKTNIGVNGATVDVNGSKVETSSNPSGSDPGGFSIPTGFITDGVANITVTAPGYQTTEKSYPMTTDSSGCSQNLTPTILITKLSSTSNSSATPAPTATTPAPSAKDVTLPTDFNQKGSSTTDLTKISDPKNVPNLTFEVVGKNKIVYKDAVDLSTGEAVKILSDLDNYVKEKKIGEVEIESKLAAFLNKRATIVMYNLSFSSTPEILVDGKIDPSVVSNISYSKGTLTFDVAHFTKFQAVANSANATAAATTNSNNQTTNLMIGLGFIGIAVGVFGAGFYYFKRNKKHHPNPAF